MAFLTAYLPDKGLQLRVKAALSLLLSQGRAPGFGVVAALQDPRKEILTFRNLFPTRIALRLAEDAEVDMVLGDGALDAGARCHEIPQSLPGVGYVRLDGVPEPTRVRFAWVTDPDITDLARAVAGPTGPPPDHGLGLDLPDPTRSRSRSPARTPGRSSGPAPHRRTSRDHHPPARPGTRRPRAPGPGPARPRTAGGPMTAAPLTLPLPGLNDPTDTPAPRNRFGRTGSGRHPGAGPRSGASAGVTAGPGEDAPRERRRP